MEKVECVQEQPYRFVCPLSCLGFQLCTVANLEGARRATGEEICYLLPSQAFVLFQVDE